MLSRTRVCQSYPFSLCPLSLCTLIQRSAWKKKDQFSEVRGSKRSVERSGKHHKTAWRNPFADETRRLSSVRCTFMHQVVATRNGATSGEFLHLRTGAQAKREDLPRRASPR